MENVPADVPYLSVDAAETATWRRRLDEFTGLRVGLAWADESRPRPTGAKARLTRLQAALLSFGEIAGVRLVSLPTDAAAASEAPHPPGSKLIDFSSELHDFGAAAALIQCLDLVIGVDGPVVHIAGALGKPVWLFNQYGGSWRWLLERDDSPWYPTLRQFRQKTPGDWREVLGAARAALQTWSSESLMQDWQRI
jgi:ADP-heptose:LPS heptosyltransferase